MIERTPEYLRYLRRIEHPYWVFNPLTYRTPMGFGIHSFAEKGEVGKFNLAWLVIPPSEDPNDIKTYQRAPLRWSFIAAPRVMLNGRSLIQHAAMHTLPEFAKMMLDNRGRIERQVAREGMTWSKFVLLLQRDDHTAGV